MNWYCNNCHTLVLDSEVAYRGKDIIHIECQHRVAPFDKVLVVGGSSIEMNEEGGFTVWSPGTAGKVYPHAQFWDAVERAVAEEFPRGWNGDRLIELLRTRRDAHD